MLKGNTECVFINTLGSALFSKVISRFIPYAIGVKGTIMDDEAISFSSGFYAALAIEKDYEKAFKNGKDLFLAQKQMKNSQKKQSASIKEDSKPNTPEKSKRRKYDEESNYFLYKNGVSSEDTTSPDDFYVPEDFNESHS